MRVAMNSAMMGMQMASRRVQSVAQSPASPVAHAITTEGAPPPLELPRLESLTSISSQTVERVMAVAAYEANAAALQSADQMLEAALDLVI